MSVPARIVTVSRPVLRPMFDEMEARLTKAGHRIAAYRTLDSFLADPAALGEADVLLAAGDTPCSRALMENAPRLRAVISPFTGTEGFDEGAATDLGILVANGQTPENSESMAESTILLMLAALYDLHGSEAVLRGVVPRPPNSRAFMLRGKTVGLIGYGNIARAMTTRLAGWGVRLLAWSRRVDPNAGPAVTWVGLEDLLRESNVVCVLLGLNAGTRGLLDEAHLRLMKPDAVLVNTARGGIIDEAALIRLARERPAMRIALDTFATEPLPAGSALRDLPDTILTPHMVGHTVESHAVLPGVAVDAVARVLAGEPPLYVRNPEVIPRWRRRLAALEPS
ncbi:MAG: D-3-phosphoglycerate dehydrogenase [Acetobacteraceae bacterium]|nr:D-3-phosphoglycerate dehydrogenase [Acetobacteraceae bacterium]